MSFWNNKEDRTVLNDAEDLAYPPGVSPWTKWFTGCLVAGVLSAYAIYAWARGSITMLGRGGSVMITGDDVGILATAYLALAAFVHFHCFWNLHRKLEYFAQPMKIVALLTFIPCISIVIYRQIGSFGILDI